MIADYAVHARDTGRPRITVDGDRVFMVASCLRLSELAEAFVDGWDADGRL